MPPARSHENFLSAAMNTTWRHEYYLLATT